MRCRTLLAPMTGLLLSAGFGKSASGPSEVRAGGGFPFSDAFDRPNATVGSGWFEHEPGGSAEISSAALRIRTGSLTGDGVDVAAMPFRWPTTEINDAKSLVAQDYAERSDVVKDKHHTGLDIRASEGTPVVAAAEGWLALVQKNAATKNCVNAQRVVLFCDHGDGNTVILGHALDDGSTVYTQYSHMADGSMDPGLMSLASASRGCTTDIARERTICTKGSILVHRGQALGTVGGTGGRPKPYDPHLHFEVKDRGRLGTESNDDGEFGYTALDPDWMGFFDPVFFLETSTVDYSDQPTALRPSAAGIGNSLRMGPGGHAADGIVSEYRAINTMQTGDAFIATASADHPAGLSNVECDMGWYQVRPRSSSYIHDANEPGPRLAGDGDTPDAWACKGHNNVLYLEPEIEPPCAAAGAMPAPSVRCLPGWLVSERGSSAIARVLPKDDQGWAALGQRARFVLVTPSGAFKATYVGSEADSVAYDTKVSLRIDTPAPAKAFSWWGWLLPESLAQNPQFYPIRERPSGDPVSRKWTVDAFVLTLRLEGTRSVSLTVQQSGRDAQLMRLRWDPDKDREVFGTVRDLTEVLSPFGAFRFAPGGPLVLVMRYWGFECTNYAVRTLTATQVVVNPSRNGSALGFCIQ